MKHLILPVIATALLLSAPVSAVAAPKHNHAHAQARKAHKQVHRARKVTRKANRATRRAHHATVRARHTTKRARRATVHARRATAHARHATVRARDATARTHRDLQRYRGAVRARHRYHWNSWHRPSGWHYRRWSVGGYMPRNWYARDYWITNYLAFSLLAPPPDYEWIRQGPDAVLVDINTGAVLRVEYDVFY